MEKNKPWKPPNHHDKLFNARELAEAYVEGFKDGYLQARQDLIENQGQPDQESPEVG